MLRTELTEKLKAAMKAQDKIRLEALRYVLALVKNAEIDKHAELTDEELVKLVASEVKKRKEAIELYQKGDRPELAKKEKEEMEILQKYLPEQLSEEEIKKLVKAAIAKTGAKEQKDMGKVMAELVSKVKGKADGSLVSKIVKESLTPK